MSWRFWRLTIVYLIVDLAAVLIGQVIFAPHFIPPWTIAP